MVNQYRGFEEALEAYLVECEVTDTCPFTGSLEQRLQGVSELYDELEENPFATVMDASSITACFALRW